MVSSIDKEEWVIEKFEDFLDKNFRKELGKAINEGQNFIVIDFSELDKFEPELGDFVLDNPDHTIPLFEDALKRIEFVGETKLNIRFNNLPETKFVKLRDIRSKHIKKFIAVEGLIRQASDVRPVIVLAVFQCPVCGTQTEILQNETTLKEPSICSCGRKGRFKLVEKKLVDTQRIVLEESPETMDTDAQPRRISVFLTDDLVEPKIEKKTSPGSRVVVAGVVREVPIVDKGAKSTRFDLMIQANYIEPSEHEFDELELTNDDIAAIKSLAKEPDVNAKLISSIAPSIYGLENIKEAIVLQLFGGSRTKRPDNTFVRGDIHILLVGDPGVAKSQLLKYVSAVAPKARYVSGKGASGAGITASVVKDEFLKGWSLEAGALVLANKGICCVDEIDKMEKDDRSAMHEAMEQQTITISKANIHSQLRSETTILAAANPKLGRFNPYDPVAGQIDMPPTLISRFDLIFILRDLPNKERDTLLASHILESFRKPEKMQPAISPDLMRKYIAYAKRNYKPKLSDDAMNEIKNFFVGLRTSRISESDEGKKAIPISPRQLEAIVRLSQASARIRLSAEVTLSDAKRAINSLRSCLEDVGIDKDTGELDIDKIVTGITASHRNRIITIKEIIQQLEKNYGSNIPLADVIDAAVDKGMERPKVEEIIDKMRKEGELFEPRHGIIRRMPR